jgi:predicted NAD-dependent protein-ADP-ribosyltransferase YbiA (DUF1768 family)
MEHKKPILNTEKGPGDRPYTAGAWREIAVHDEKNIKGFFGPYRFLSNTWPANIVLDEVVYPSVEHAYKAWRWKPSSRSYFETCTALEAIAYNRDHTPDGPSDDEWNVQKVEVMTFLEKQKYNKEQNPELYQKLKETGDRYLEETNWWDDRFWGVDEEGVGENNLGKVLMRVREEI